MATALKSKRRLTRTEQAIEESQKCFVANGDMTYPGFSFTALSEYCRLNTQILVVYYR